MGYEDFYAKHGPGASTEVSVRMTAPSTGRTYRISCNSCRETSRFDEFDEAQAAFNEHAASNHEVELCRVDTAPSDGDPDVEDEA